LLIETFKDILPKAVWDRKKQGFAFPFQKWMQGVKPHSANVVVSERLHKKFLKGDLAWSRYYAYILTHPSFSKNKENTKSQNVLFLNLATFSKTGGIEKFNKCLLKALNDIDREGLISAESYSAYDNNSQENYFPNALYKGFAKNRLAFVYNSILNARHFDTIILGHINLSIIGLMIKLLWPAKKLILITHGIEVMEALSFPKSSLLKKADLILAVSNFTKNNLINIQNIEASRIKIFHNTIDPNFIVPDTFDKPEYLQQRYGIKKGDTVIYTLSRLSSSEQYKGYDQVIKALAMQNGSLNNYKYIIAGKGDDKEITRLKQMVNELGLNDNIILSGFVKDSELSDHYKMADIFIMPSRGEGFGIVFLEAMVHGLPVIAGNCDGSVDALKNGELGRLVSPDNIEEVSEAILTEVKNLELRTEAMMHKLQKDSIATFGFDTFRDKLRGILVDLLVTLNGMPTITQMPILPVILTKEGSAS